MGSCIDRSAATFDKIFAFGTYFFTTLKIGIPSAVAVYFTKVRL
jgi:hypothetical protein